MNPISSISVLPNAHFLDSMQQGIRDEDDSVIGPILLYCAGVQNSSDVQQASSLLFQVFSRLSEKELESFLKNQLPCLLHHASLQQQRTLSLQLALGFAARGNGLFSSSLQSMHYFAKTIQIAHHCNDLGNTHQLASQLFMLIIRRLLIHDDAFQKTLTPFQKVSQDDHYAFQIMEAHITRITLLKRFCCEESDLKIIAALYKQASTVLSRVNVGLQERYVSCSRKVLAGLNEPCSLPEKTPTERYWEALLGFRNSFQNINNVRDFQKTATEAFRKFFKVFIEDALAVLGPAPSTYSKMKYSSPCRFDIRAMGSLGREEVCPYSDLEFLILVEREDAIPYFKTLVHILEIQIACLGETSTDNPVFTCIHIKNPSGLHIDSGGNPALHLDLIQTPPNMAKLQDNPVDDPQTIENTVLKTISLYQSDTFLFAEYQEALKIPLEACRENRAYMLFATEMADYKERWKQPFNPKAGIVNIKDQYVKLLNYLLSDIALFCGVKETNTLDIVDVLVTQEIFTPDSGFLLKESIATIYKIRIRLHLHYKEQKEEASCNPHLSLCTLTSEEILALEKSYWLVLNPLYHTLEKVLSLGPNSFREVFHKIDLIQVTFNENLSSLHPSLIRPLATQLYQTKASLNTHLSYFKALSQIASESLRQTYLACIPENINLFQTLLQVPNRGGLRPVFFKNFEKLEASIQAITEQVSTQLHGKMEITLISSHFKRYLRPDIIEQIMEGENIRQMYTNSAHRVCCLNYNGHKLHFKQKPSHPVMEYAIHSLTSRLAGQITPATELVRFDIVFQGKKKSYPVLISETILGSNLKDSWSTFQSQTKYTANFTWHLLCSILTRPGDGRLANYILDPEQNIHCIDNDISFIEPVVAETFYRTIHFCSSLFCILPLNTSLDQNVLEQFLTLDPYAIIDGWIENLIHKEGEYSKLFSEEERKILYEEDPNSSFTPTLLFREGTLTTLHLQFWHLQQTISLSLQKKHPLTAGELLQKLLSLREQSIGIHIYKAYLNHKSTPEERLQVATSKTQTQSMTSVQYHQACLGKVPSHQEIATLKLYSLENAKKEFYATFLERNSLFATLKNTSQGLTVQANLKDLSHETSRQDLVLKALIEQINIMAKKPATIILQHSNQLTSDLLALFLHPDLEILDLRYCTAINDIAIILIQEKCPQLKKLYLSGCTGLKEVEQSYFSLGPTLNFSALEHLELSRCDNLITLQIEAPALKSCIMKHNPLLKNCENEAILLAAIREDASAFQYAHKSLQIDYIFVLKAMKLNPAVLQYVGETFILKIIDYSYGSLKKDKAFILAAVTYNGYILRYADKSLKKDKDVVLAAVTQNDIALLYADESFKKDKDVVLAAVTQNDKALLYVDESFKKDKDVVLAAVKQNGYALFYADDNIKKDKDVVLAAVTQQAIALLYADNNLKRVKDFVLAAVTKNGFALQYVDESFRKDKDVVLAAVKETGSSLQFADKYLTKDKDVVLAAVTQNGKALFYTDENLKKDKDVILAALQYADDSLKKNKDFVLTAVTQNGSALQYADKSLKRDKNFVLAAVIQNGSALQYADESFKRDKDFVLAAVTQNGSALQYAHESFKKDKDIVLVAVSQNGQALFYASESLKKDKDVVLVAVSQNDKALLYADESFKKDKDVILVAVSHNGYTLQYVDESFKKDKDVVLAAVTHDGSALQYADNSLKRVKDFVLAAVTKNGFALQYVDESFKKDKDVVLAAVAQNGSALQYAHESLKKDKDVILVAVPQNDSALKSTNESLHLVSFFEAF